MIRLFYLLALSTLFSCGNKQQTAPVTEQPAVQQTAKTTNTPDFNADSAYLYVKNQVDFGPRVPNTQAHKNCSKYLAAELKRFGAKVYLQEMNVTAYNNESLEACNVIGSYNPDADKRILLFAHWDSRPYADHDPDPKNHKTPIDGADDGASGVGVLLEIARQLQMKAPTVGIDIIFFDAEDYGTPEFVDEYKPNTWCLGTQFWTKNTHVPNYRADFGILLDMVGSKDAVFYKENTSMRYAARYVDLVWNTARNIGYGKHFINAEGGGVIDDHQYVITGKSIPCLDIINYDPETEKGFGAYWHTKNDNINVIEKKTLKAVGQTVLEVIYNYK